MLFELVVGFTPFTGFETTEIYEKVLGYAESEFLDFPKNDLFTDVCKTLILGLLTAKKNRRLGVKYPGVDGIKQHPFFSSFSWQALHDGTMVPPPMPISKKMNKLSSATGEGYDAQLYFAPDDITGWTRTFNYTPPQ